MSSRTDTAIFERVIDLGAGEMSADAARYFLALDFPVKDHARMEELSARAREGALTEDEESQLDDYLHVGHIIALIQSMARRSLGKPGIAVQR